ncbi:MAG: IS1595 family transposase, partial [Campylobacter hominis]|nr:IS1595 family transposase [Campylobacter hominis]
MTAMKNKYIKNSKISEAKFREILKYFCEDL